MSARPLMGGVLSVLFAATLSTAQARDWTELAITPMADPLSANPPRLVTGKTLPGDAEPYRCDQAEAPDFSVPLTLAVAVDLALCQNPQVQSAWAAIKVQAAQVGEARSAYLPTLTLGASRLHQNTITSESNFVVNTDRTSTAQYATLSWRLLDMGARDANRRSANALLNAALASHEAVLQTTMAKAIGAYFDAQTAKAAHAAKGKNELLARRTLETARKRESGGTGARADTLQAQTALARAELDNARSLGAYEKAVSALAVILGLPLQAQTTGIMLADDNLDTVYAFRNDLAGRLSMAQQQHPALLSARSQLEAVREKLIAARSEGLPTIDFTHSRHINGLPNQGLSSTGMRQTYSGFTLNIPLFEGFGRTYKVRGAQAQIEVKEAELRDIESRVLDEVARAHADAVAALRNLESSSRLAGTAMAALEEVRKKYERGVADVLEMLNVQASLAQAEQEQVRTQAEWRSARLRLLASAGTIGRKDVRESGHPLEIGNGSSVLNGHPNRHPVWYLEEEGRKTLARR